LLERRIKPSVHMDVIGRALPKIYSPLQANGRGNQNLYLTTVTPLLADVLMSLIGEQAFDLRHALSMTATSNVGGDFGENAPLAQGLVEWEEYLIEEVNKDDRLAETERLSLILARRGQGVFKQNVMRIESHC